MTLTCDKFERREIREDHSLGAMARYCASNQQYYVSRARQAFEGTLLHVSSTLLCLSCFSFWFVVKYSLPYDVSVTNMQDA